jgi:hypothetical protein
MNLIRVLLVDWLRRVAGEVRIQLLANESGGANQEENDDGRQLGRAHDTSGEFLLRASLGSQCPTVGPSFERR